MGAIRGGKPACGPRPGPSTNSTENDPPLNAARSLGKADQVQPSGQQGQRDGAEAGETGPPQS